MNTLPQPPGPSRPIPWWKTHPRQSRLPRLLQDLAQRYGDFVRFRLQNETCYLLNHPDFIAAVFNAPAEDFLPAPRLSIGYPFDVLRQEEGVFPLGDYREISLLARQMRAADNQRKAIALMKELERQGAPLTPTAQNQLARRITLALGHIQQDPVLAASLEDEAILLWGQDAPTPEDSLALSAFDEALRLDPPVRLRAFRAARRMSIGGYPLEAGAVLLISPWVMHHDPRFYPNPERFDPDRWQPETRRQRPPLAFLPFGEPPGCCPEEKSLRGIGALAIAALVTMPQQPLQAAAR